MSSPSSCCGVILTGGASVRMGTDKASLEWKAQTFTDALTTLLRRHCSDVVCAGGPARHETLTTLLDDEAGSGPLAGIAAALGSGRASRYLVVSCDAPALVDEDLAPLLNMPGAASFADEERRWPLPCVLPAEARATALKRLEGGRRSLQGFLDACGAARLPVGDRTLRIQGVNTPEELARLLSTDSEAHD